MSEFMERVQEVALRRWPVGNQPTFGPADYMDMGTRTGFVLGASFARTVTREEVEKAARAIDPSSWRIRDGGPFPPDHIAAITVVRKSWDQAIAALVALGFEVEQ